MSESIWDRAKRLDGFCIFCESKLLPHEHIVSYTFRGETRKVDTNYCTKCEEMTGEQLNERIRQKILRGDLDS